MTSSMSTCAGGMVGKTWNLCSSHIILSLSSYRCDLHDKVALPVLLLCYNVFCIEHVLTCKDVTGFHCTQPMSMCRGENHSSIINSICTGGIDCTTDETRERSTASGFIWQHLLSFFGMAPHL